MNCYIPMYVTMESDLSAFPLGKRGFNRCQILLLNFYA